MTKKNTDWTHWLDMKDEATAREEIYSEAFHGATDVMIGAWQRYVHRYRPDLAASEKRERKARMAFMEELLNDMGQIAS